MRIWLYCLVETYGRRAPEANTWVVITKPAIDVQPTLTAPEGKYDLVLIVLLGPNPDREHLAALLARPGNTVQVQGLDAGPVPPITTLLVQDLRLVLVVQQGPSQMPDQVDALLARPGSTGQVQVLDAGHVPLVTIAQEQELLLALVVLLEKFLELVLLHRVTVIMVTYHIIE